jgi:excisionase family DNA binding protein
MAPAVGAIFLSYPPVLTLHALAGERVDAPTPKEGAHMPHLMTQREVAELLRCSERQVSRYRASGRLPFQKLDNGVRIRREHAEALLSTPTPPAQKSWTPTRWRDSDELPPALLRPVVRRTA